MVNVICTKLHTMETMLAVMLVCFVLLIIAGVVCLYKMYHSMRERNLQEVALDDLTGLPTKQQHKIDATRILKKSRNKFAYVSCEIEDFKYLNETYGYAYGNLALKCVAGVFSKRLKKNELLCRITEDHFCMLLQYEKVDALEKRLRKMLEEASVFPVDEKGGCHQVFFHCGVYLIQKNDDINMIRFRSSTARKSITTKLETSIQFYSREAVNKELKEKELEKAVQDALKLNQLMVYFQPKFEISSEKIIGAEALVRWNHPEKGILPPSAFVPICEENGFVCEIDFFVFEEVCKRMKRWKEEGRHLVKISVNFSRKHISNKKFVERLVEIVRYYGVEPSNLEIELTETLAYDDMDELLKVMRQIKEYGFGLSMDDFGSGYSSLNLLREMPLDVLKLDKAFFDNFGNNSSGREKRIVSHVISMAKDLDISVLAEGVETAQQWNFLKESHCDMIQGYYYVKPMPTEKFEQYLEKVSA